MSAPTHTSHAQWTGGRGVSKEQAGGFRGEWVCLAVPVWVIGSGLGGLLGYWRCAW